MMSKDCFPVDLCLKCSTCNTVCPVYAVEEKFPGPKYIGPELARLSKEKDCHKAAVEYCTGCRQCELACPAGVKIASLAEEAKALLAREKGVPLRNYILARNESISKIASRTAPLTNMVLGMRLVRRAAEQTIGLANRQFPVFRQPLKINTRIKTGSNFKAVYFVGCYARYNEPGIASAVVNTLAAYGGEVVVPPQKCCGVPMLANGLKESAKSNAGHNLAILASYVQQGFEIISSCPSCALSLKQDYNRHFDLPHAGMVAARVYDAAEFLLQLTKKHKPAVKLKALEQTLFYHQPCHAKAQGIGSPASELLRLIPGLRLVSKDQKCCGQAGTYGFKQEKYHIANKIGATLWDDVRQAEVEGIVTECGMCKLQLAQGTGKPVYHPLEVLSKALLTL